MNLFDSHCHIQSVGRKAQGNTAKLWAKSGLSQKQIIDRAIEAGVKQLMVVGCDLQDSRDAVELAANYSNLFTAAGIHPHEADQYAGKNELLRQFADLATNQEVKAIGECGLDYFYLHATKENQKQILEFQLELASKLDLPLIFHVREAFNDFWAIFKRFNSANKLRGVLHSYTDDETNLETAIKSGLFIGVNGIATFSKDQKQQAMYKRIPLDKLILETDAPYLTPTPLRGNINEPRNVVLVAKYLAGARGESLPNLARATTSNSRQLFGV